MKNRTILNFRESGMVRPIATIVWPGIVRLPVRTAISALLLTLFAAATATRVQAQETRKTLSAPTPVYPQLARHLQLTGTVKIQIVVAKDGTVQNASVIGGHPILVESALETVKRWKYERGTAETMITVQFNFHP